MHDHNSQPQNKYAAVLQLLVQIMLCSLKTEFHKLYCNSQMRFLLEISTFFYIAVNV
jgi:hypothetical protein